MPTPANAYKPHTRRRNGVLVSLPAEGRTEPAPPMPPGREWSADQRRTWEALWATPQATMWDPGSHGQTVAMYVVHSSEVLAGTAAAWNAAEARFLGDRLGLSPQGMAALGWAIEETGAETGSGRLWSSSPALDRARLAAETGRAPSARDRMAVVDPETA